MHKALLLQVKTTYKIIDLCNESIATPDMEMGFALSILNTQESNMRNIELYMFVELFEIKELLRKQISKAVGKATFL